MFHRAGQHEKDDCNESNNGSFLSKFMSLNLAKLADEECLPVARQRNDAPMAKSLPSKHYESGGMTNISPFRSERSLSDVPNTPMVTVSCSYIKNTTCDEKAHVQPNLTDSRNSTTNSILASMAEEELPSNISENNSATVTRASSVQGLWKKSASNNYEDLKINPQQHQRPSLVNDELFQDLQNELKSAQAITSASIEEVTAKFLNEQKKKQRQEELKQRQNDRDEKRNKDNNSSPHVKGGQSLKSTLVVMTGLQGIQDVFSSITTQIRQDLEGEKSSRRGKSEIVITRGSLDSNESTSEKVAFGDLSNYFEDTIHEDTIREESGDELSTNSFNDHDDDGNDNKDNKRTVICTESRLATKRKSSRRSRISLSSIKHEEDAVVLLAYNPGDVDGNKRISIITMGSSSCSTRSLERVIEDDDEMGLDGQKSTFSDSDKTPKKHPRFSSNQRRSSVRFDKLNRSSMALLTDESHKLGMKKGKNTLDEDQMNPQITDMQKLMQSFASGPTTRVSALAFECDVDFDDIVNTADGDK